MARRIIYEEEIDDLIVGFSEDNEPVWLEILDVSKRFIPEILSKISRAALEKVLLRPPERLDK